MWPGSVKRNRLVKIEPRFRQSEELPLVTVQNKSSFQIDILFRLQNVEKGANFTCFVHSVYIFVLEIWQGAQRYVLYKEKSQWSCKTCDHEKYWQKHSNKAKNNLYNLVYFIIFSTIDMLKGTWNMIVVINVHLTGKSHWEIF